MNSLINSNDIIRKGINLDLFTNKNDLIKAEGSRGGKIIGHTKSGKPIYAQKKAFEYKDFSKQDHKDAAAEHHSISNAGKSGKGYAPHHAEVRNSHLEASKKDNKPKTTEKESHKVGDKVVDKEGKKGKITHADDKEVAVEHDNGDVTGYKHHEVKKQENTEKAETLDLEKGEIADAFQYNNIKFKNTGKEVKEALSVVRTDKEKECKELAIKIETLKTALLIPPFSQVSEYNYRGFKNKISTQYIYPHCMTYYYENSESKASYELDGLTEGAKQKVEEALPTSKEEAAKFSNFNNIVYQYISTEVDVHTIDMYLRNLKDGQTYEFDSRQVAALGL